MNKLALILIIVALFSISFSSCKKCTTCKVVASDGSVITHSELKLRDEYCGNKFDRQAFEDDVMFAAKQMECIICEIYATDTSGQDTTFYAPMKKHIRFTLKTYGGMSKESDNEIQDFVQEANLAASALNRIAICNDEQVINDWAARIADPERSDESGSSKATVTCSTAK